MAEDINNLLARLKFSEEESMSVVGLRKDSMDDQGYEAWAIDKVLSKDKINRDAMYRVLKLIWFTKEPVSFVFMDEGAYLVKFGIIEDRTRILNMAPWLFDQCLFSIPTFVKGQVVVDIGGVLGELVAIDWRDRKGCWIKYLRIRVKTDVSKPLRWVIKMVGLDGIEILCTIQNGVEFLGGARISSNINAMEERENEEGDTIIQRGKGKGKMGEEVSDSGSLTEKRPRMNVKEGGNKMRNKRKKGKGRGWSHEDFFWNCRGIGNPAIVHDLKQLLVVTNPDIVFLSETKVRSSEMERIRIRCHTDGCFVVEANGRRGDLALL
ncbi:hypothetical protein Gotur_033146 [Gossypium turneri]